MVEEVDNEPCFWVEEPHDPLPISGKMKRKVRPKKMEFVGWGSKPLIEFLESIGKDTSKQISHYDVTAIINEYVKTMNLIHPLKKKRILCDERLQSLFGKKSLARIKIYDLLETHFAENQNDSDEEFFYSSEENDKKALMDSKQHKASNADKKNLHPKKRIQEAPKSCFAAIIPANIKLLYLKRSLVQDLKKETEIFESKVLGSFVRVKKDPNDYFQKNSHLLLQVTGVKGLSGEGNTCSEILLQVSNMMDDIRICMLSDDNFSEEECEDLRQRVKNGTIKRPTVVEFQEKAQLLHKDITKHWLVRELALLQNLIDRANEKGWRKELFEYLERRQLLQKPAEQERLLLEVPIVIADELEQEAKPEERTNGSPRSILRGASLVPTENSEAVQTLPAQDGENASIAEIENDADIEPTQLVRQEVVHITDTEEPSNVDPQQKRVEENVLATREVVELSDDEEEVAAAEHCGVLNQDQLEDDGRKPMWHYVDPQGNVQGPFPKLILERWSEANYFPPDFKVWRMGQSRDDAILLSDLFLQ